MKRLINFLLFVSFFNFLTSCNGQTKQKITQEQINIERIVGGGCEGCELMYVDIPKFISSEDTSIGWEEGKQKLVLTGKVFQLDGKNACQ